MGGVTGWKGKVSVSLLLIQPRRGKDPGEVLNVSPSRGESRDNKKGMEEEGRTRGGK